MVTLSAVLNDPLSICMNRLSVERLEHERNEKPLFHNVDAEWQSGDLVQLVGPNGSGKTTFLRIVCGLIRPTSGEVRWNGHSSKSFEFLSSLLYLGHQIGVKTSLTPLENLRWYFGIHGTKAEGASQVLPSEESMLSALDKVGLSALVHTPCYSLSAGQQRRSALARLYLSEAPLWILDEPFTAIDKQGVKELEELIHVHTDRGGIVVVTTHQSFNAENVKILDLAQYKPKRRAYL